MRIIGTSFLIAHNMKYISICFFVAAPLFLVWSIGYWENQLSYFIFMLLLLLGIIFATRKPKHESYDVNPDDPEYQKRRQEAAEKAQQPISWQLSPVVWLGGLFVIIVIYIIINRIIH